MQALSTSWPFLCGGGKVRKKKSVEDWIRGPIVRIDSSEEITARHVVEAIDIHIMPALVLVYEELADLCCENLSDHNKLQAENYLQIFHNTLVLLSRIEAEATGMQKKEVEP